MLGCWTKDPTSRPGFAELENKLVSLIDDGYVSTSNNEGEEFFPEPDYVDMASNTKAKNEYLQLVG